ncbi:MAG: NAD(P)H:quinone oxidoreductase [Gammaproteobacteria bacterium]|nr:MAG: NAD(P)H:quinone oxidoreductase [Gammaproteobacteria bacterium]
MPYVLVLYYSCHGAVSELARYLARGINAVEGIEARMRTAAPVSATCEQVDPSVPETGNPYVTLEDLQHCAGLALGSPSYFGNIASPLKYFLEQTTPLWASGALSGKPATVFTSSSSLHGGQESLLLSMMQPLFHHGMILMGTPYTEPDLATTTTGGTPYGVSHYAGPDNIHPVSPEEKNLCLATGRRLAELALRLDRKG